MRAMSACLRPDGVSTIFGSIIAQGSESNIYEVLASTLSHTLTAFRVDLNYGLWCFFLLM